MGNFKKLKLAVVLAAAAMMICAGTVSADKFTSPAGTTYTSSILAQSGSIALHGTFTTISCGSSVIEAQVQKHSLLSFDTGGEINYLNFSLCNFPLKVLDAGAMDVSAWGGGNGDFQLFYTTLTAETSIANCLFTASSTGSTVGSFIGGASSHAIIELSGAIPRTGHSIFCGSSAQITARYEVMTPSRLIVD